jgi:predicted GIY-YIG superfamily endonuclease
VKTRHHHRVYVVRLDHPRAKGRGAFYVGMTGLDVEERFANHKRGYKCSRIVQKYGVELAREWFDGIPAMSYEEAALTEPTLADDLRDLGYLVFGPTNRKAVKSQKRRR